MQGDPEIVARLNRLLTDELTAIDLYVLQSRMFQDWGYEKLFARLDHEKDDEMAHATRLVERILFLEGTPDIQTRAGFQLPSDVKAMLQMDLELEYEVARNLNDGIALCRDRGDDASRQLLEELLVDTESDHIFWLESQLRQIEDVGIENYLAEQT